MGRRNMPFVPDETDLRIISLLQEDGRMSNVDLARTLVMAEGTVRKRVDRLISERVIRVVVLPNPATVGCPLLAVIMLCVDLAHIERVGQMLKETPEVRWVAHATGKYDLILEAAFASDEQLLHFLTGQLAGIPGIQSTTTAHVLRTVKSLADWRLPQLPPPTILVVDDDADYVEMTRTVLETAGYRVLSAANGSQALSLMRREHPALVIMDVMMDGLLDGLNASRAIRLDQNLQRIPIIMISSITRSEYADMFPASESIPIDVFLAKPVNPTRLLEEIQRLIKLSSRSSVLFQKEE
jgi:Lrp/AsnC family transcriptional regulator for asnA, asnC and gidA